MIALQINLGCNDFFGQGSSLSLQRLSCDLKGKRGLPTNTRLTTQTTGMLSSEKGLFAVHMVAY